MSERWNEPPAGAAPGLSPAGAARRAAMLDDLVHVMERVHRGRRGRRGALAAAVLVVAGAGATLLALPRPAPAPEAVVKAAPTPPPRVDYREVEPDAGVLARYAVTTTSRTTEMLDDGRLLAVLASMNRPTGLVRRDGRVHLTSEVVDPAEG